MESTKITGFVPRWSYDYYPCSRTIGVFIFKRRSSLYLTSSCDFVDFDGNLANYLDLDNLPTGTELRSDYGSAELTDLWFYDAVTDRYKLYVEVKQSLGQGYYLVPLKRSYVEDTLKLRFNLPSEVSISPKDVIVSTLLGYILYLGYILLTPLFVLRLFVKRFNLLPLYLVTLIYYLVNYYLGYSLPMSEPYAYWYVGFALLLSPRLLSYKVWVNFLNDLADLLNIPNYYEFGVKYLFQMETGSSSWFGGSPSRYAVSDRGLLSRYSYMGHLYVLNNKSLFTGNEYEIYSGKSSLQFPKVEGVSTADLDIKDFTKYLVRYLNKETYFVPKFYLDLFNLYGSKVRKFKSEKGYPDTEFLSQLYAFVKVNFTKQEFKAAITEVWSLNED